MPRYRAAARRPEANPCPCLRPRCLARSCADSRSPPLTSLPGARGSSLELGRTCPSRSRCAQVQRALLNGCSSSPGSRLLSTRQVQGLMRGRSLTGLDWPAYAGCSFARVVSRWGCPLRKISPSFGPISRALSWLTTLKATSGCSRRMVYWCLTGTALPLKILSWRVYATSSSSSQTPMTSGVFCLGSAKQLLPVMSRGLEH
mmetsp:Transcript_13495/g.28138  ORF Transcript_13495/g.28138 Transcript_13495/m.28138 type:complete len:202 (-) Transcript_13495:32-637(-)